MLPDVRFMAKMHQIRMHKVSY